MIDGKKLLDQFLGAGNAAGAGAPGGAGGLGDLLGALTGGRTAGGPSAGGASGGGLSAGGLSAGGLGDLVGQVTNYAKQNPGLSTAAAGGLAAVLLGNKKLKADAFTIGGLAALGTLAYKAYQQYQANNPAAPAAPTPAPAPSPWGQALPPPVASHAATPEDAAALSIIIAMVAAAKADGTVDEEERRRIVGKLSENGLTAEEQAFLEREIAAPFDFNRVVSLAASPEQAIQLYAASLLAITADTPAERGYLDMLAARLGIEPGLKTAIEQTVASAAA